MLTRKNYCMIFHTTFDDSSLLWFFFYFLGLYFREESSHINYIPKVFLQCGFSDVQ